MGNRARIKKARRWAKTLVEAQTDDRARLAIVRQLYDRDVINAKTARELEAIQIQQGNMITL